MGGGEGSVAVGGGEEGGQGAHKGLLLIKENPIHHTLEKFTPWVNKMWGPDEEKL